MVFVSKYSLSLSRYSQAKGPKGYQEEAEILFRKMGFEQDLEDLDRFKSLGGFNKQVLYQSLSVIFLLISH